MCLIQILLLNPKIYPTDANEDMNFSDNEDTDDEIQKWVFPLC